MPARALVKPRLFRVCIETRIFQPQEIDMSADKDRGIRRIKQKRAKDQKRAAKQAKSGKPAPAKS